MTCYIVRTTPERVAGQTVTFSSQVSDLEVARAIGKRMLVLASPVQIVHDRTICRNPRHPRSDKELVEVLA